MNLFRRALIRIGNCTYHLTEGKMVDLGDISGASLRQLAHKMRLPVVHVYPDRATLPCVYESRQLKPFHFDRPESSSSLWHLTLSKAGKIVGARY